MSDEVELRRVSVKAFPAVRGGIIRVLRDAVANGASVSYVEVPTDAEAAAFCDKLAAGLAEETTELFVAEVGGEVVGTVQFHACIIPNQRHRGDVSKLLVHSSARRRGIARRLMETLEAAARQRGLGLLMLDTHHGGAAERLYLQMGWTPMGIVPAHALSTEGKLEPTTFFYKQL